MGGQGYSPNKDEAEQLELEDTNQKRLIPTNNDNIHEQMAAQCAKLDGDETSQTDDDGDADSIKSFKKTALAEQAHQGVDRSAGPK